MFAPKSMFLLLLAYIVGVASSFALIEYKTPSVVIESSVSNPAVMEHCVQVKDLPIAFTGSPEKAMTYNRSSALKRGILPDSYIASTDLEKQALGVSLLVAENSVESRRALREISLDANRTSLVRTVAIEGMQAQWQFFPDDLLQLTKSEQAEIRKSAFVASNNLSDDVKSSFIHEALSRLSIENDVATAISMVELVRNSTDSHLLSSYINTPPQMIDIDSIQQWNEYICADALSEFRSTSVKCKN